MNKFDKAGMNLKTRELLSEDGERNHLDESEYGSIENLYIITMIEIFTREINNTVIEKIFDDEDTIRRFHNGEKVDGSYEIDMDGYYRIPFELFSDNLPYQFERFKKELESENRLHECHTRSLILAQELEGSVILTGILKKGKYCYLHSVLEVMDPKTLKKKIIDWTRNLVIDKEDYLKLFEFNILSEVDSYTLINDYEFLDKYGLINISSKAYLTFRDEIIRDLKRNSFLLQDNDEKHLR